MNNAIINNNTLIKINLKHFIKFKNFICIYKTLKFD